MERSRWRLQHDAWHTATASRRSFRKRLPNNVCPETLAEVVSMLAEFLLPVAHACADGKSFGLGRGATLTAASKPMGQALPRLHAQNSALSEGHLPALSIPG